MPLYFTIGTTSFRGSTGAAVVPAKVFIVSWELQLRVVFDWKTPAEMQTVDLLRLQATMVLLGTINLSYHPTMVVFTDGTSFAIYQLKGRAITVLHARGAGSSPSASDAMRHIVHYLSACSKDPQFMPEGQDAQVGPEVREVLPAFIEIKEKLDEGPGPLVEQLDVDLMLPPHERIDAILQTLSTWQAAFASDDGDDSE
eukprot:TRINITY_DN19090_c0_g1_i1.p1 TRINITY_DN19090_c0_g1~~TRINITY_DN19090_c0_g1_i1.p1  ORF type:complete len:228 (-),score=50.20 TRINITY_DN19090_c0_g1_i1:66-662(-)